MRKRSYVREMTIVSVRLSKRFKKIVERYIKVDLHKDISEFIRDAMREKIQRDAPLLYDELFKRKNEE